MSRTSGPTENYIRLFDPLYGVILLRTLALSVVATLLCLVLGFPLALFIARSDKRKNLYLQLVMIPFWTSFLVRTYAWMFLLRDTGLINSALLAAWCHPRTACRCSTTMAPCWSDSSTAYLPFVVLPLFATLERMDKNLLEAAADLGARPLEIRHARRDSSLRSGLSRRSGAGVHPLPRRVSHA